jgi:putative cell wall-binding protein
VDLPASPVAGELDAATKVADVYRVSLGGGVRFACTLEGDAGLDADVYVFPSGATEIDPSAAYAGTVGDAFPKTLTFDVRPGADSDYYIVVRTVSGKGTYALAWSTCAMPGSADDDIAGTALPSRDGALSGALSWPTDTYDVFSIDMAQGERIEATLHGPSGSDFDVLLYRPGSESVYSDLPVDGSSGSGSDENLLHDVMAGEGGTYYLAVRAVRGSGAFTLAWTVSAIPDGAWEDFDSAPVVAGTSGVQLGTLDRSNDANDVFKVSLCAGQRLSLRLDGESGTDFDLYLHSPDRSRVLAYANDSAYPEALVFDAASDGVYFIELRAFGGAGAYRLEWSIGATPVFSAAERLSGADRYLTAVAVSKATFPAGSAASVVLASGEVFPDALCASALAGCLDSPVLLTHATSLPAAVLAEIGRLGARRVYIVGGPAVVSDGVKTALAQAGLTVERVYGSDRYDTAKAVAAKVRALRGASFGAQAFLVRGDQFPDALSASAAAWALKMPILLTRPTVLHPSARAAIAANGIKDVYIVGGTGAVSDAVKGEVSGLVSGTVQRLAGQDRYATAKEVAAYALRYYWLEPSVVYVARGDQFPDALGGGAAAGKQNAALLLTDPKTLSPATREYLGANKGVITAGRIVGGAAAVFDGVKAEIEGVLKP